MSEKTTKFQEVLNETHQWPCPYTFKFIVPSENLHIVETTFPGEDFKTKESKNGKYTSVTMTTNMCSSKDVMAVYEKAATIPGVMSL